MFSVGFDIEIIKRWGRWFPPNLHTYIWRDEHILSHIGRGMVKSNAFSGRVGGERGISQTTPNEFTRHQRLVEISKTMSGALRHRELPTMDKQGWATLKVVCDLPRLRELRATLGDVRLIINGEGGNRKRRFELSPDGRCIRCAQGHSAKSGGRPDALPETKKLKYLIHGTSIEAAKRIATDGLSKCSRLHIHFYECDQRGIALGGNVLRHDSAVGIAVLAHHCIEDGIVFRRSPNDVILTEGINGILGPQYIRFACEISRDPYAHRRWIWGKSDPVWKLPGLDQPKGDVSREYEAHTTHSAAPSVITKTHCPDTVEEDEEERNPTMNQGVSDADDELTLGELSARMEDAQRDTKLHRVELEAVGGLNPFSESGRDTGTVGTRSAGRTSHGGPFLMLTPTSGVCARLKGRDTRPILLPLTLLIRLRRRVVKKSNKRRMMSRMRSMLMLLQHYWIMIR